MAKALEFEVEGQMDPETGLIRPLHFSLYKNLFRRAGFMAEDVLLIVKVRKFSRRRTDRQNRYIHGVAVPCVQSWKFDTEGVKWTHDSTYFWIRRALLEHDVEIQEVAGYQVPVMTGKRFSQMTVEEFSYAVFDVIIPKMAEMGCVIPLPRGENLLTDHLQDDQ